MAIEWKGQRQVDIWKKWSAVLWSVLLSAVEQQRVRLQER